MPILIFTTVLSAFSQRLNRSALAAAFSPFSGMCAVAGVIAAFPGAVFNPVAAGGELVLAEAGNTEYVIVLANDAIAAEQTASQELNKYLEKITGAEFVITTPDDVPPGQPKIYVGPSATARRLAPEISLADLGTDGIVIKTVGRDLVLAGGRPRGTLYAVYTFLQDELGCRWYADDMPELVPENSTLRIAEQKTVYRPPFDLRWLYVQMQRSGENKDPLFSAKFRQNGGSRPEKYGGGVGYGGAHTMNRWILPADEFFDDHPNWYAMPPDGEHSLGQGVPCYSSSGAREKTAERILDRLREIYPDWLYAPEKIISVSHPDVSKHCRCEKCQAALERYGSDSGALLEFVNYVAGEVEKEFPDVLISTLAYWNTAAPPKGIKARGNVLIHFGISNAAFNPAYPRGEIVVRDFRRPFFESSVFNRWLADWFQVARHVYIWDYHTNFRNMIQPHPTYFSFPGSFPLYRDQGVTGIFSQGGWSRAGDFPRLKYWVNSQMMWNPDRDGRTLAREFLTAYFGAAAPHLMDYLELMSGIDSALRPFVTCTRGWLELEDLNRATMLFNRALAAVAGNEKLEFRVRRNRLSIDIVWLQSYRELRRIAREKDLPFLGPDDPYAETERIAENEFNAGVYREWGSFNEYVNHLRQLFPPRESDPPSVRGLLQPYRWLEIQPSLLQTSDSSKESIAIVDDPNASNGNALRLDLISSPEAQAWYKLPGETSGPGPNLRADLAGRWRVYAVIRVETADGPAGIVCGLRAGDDEFYRKIIDADFPPGRESAYRTMDFGEYDLAVGNEIFVRARDLEMQGKVRALYVDRFILIAVDME